MSRTGPDFEIAMPGMREIDIDDQGRPYPLKPGQRSLSEGKKTPYRRMGAHVRSKSDFICSRLDQAARLIEQIPRYQDPYYHISEIIDCFDQAIDEVQDIVDDLRKLQRNLRR